MIMGNPKIQLDAKKVLANLVKTKKVTEEAIKGALHTEAELIMTASKRIVPHETGDLEATGHVGDPAVRGRKVRTIFIPMNYGTEYALIQHEDKNLKHKHGRQSHYLSGPLNDRASKMPARVVKRLKKRLGSAFRG